MTLPPDLPAKTSPDYRGLIKQASRPPNQSSLYRWLEAMFEALGPNPGRVSDWGPICDAAHADGVTGGKGQAPTPRLVADQWRKIKRRRAVLSMMPAETSGLRRDRPPMTTKGPLPPPNMEADRTRGTSASTRSELAWPCPTLPAVAGPKDLTAEEKQRRGQAEADRVLAQLSAASHRKWGFGPVEGES